MSEIGLGLKRDKSPSVVVTGIGQNLRELDWQIPVCFVI
jgi:hypothetical protein